MISDDERYKDLSAAITGRIQLIRDAFKLFLQLFTTVAGGSIWLNMQTIPTHAKSIYAIVTDVLVALIFLVTSLMVYAAMQSWWKYRKTLAEFAGEQYSIPPPRLQAFIAEIAMLACMFTASMIFGFLNPFTVISN